MDYQKICGVCGDKAFGYNFNALTCESCKAFFRRNALRNKTFRCPTNGNCVLTIKTRKYCRRCRLSKCYEIGMKRDWILTEEDKLSKRRGRNHRMRKDSCTDLDADSSQTQTHQSHHHHVGLVSDTTTTTSSSLLAASTKTGQNEPNNNNNNNNFNKSDKDKPAAEMADVRTNIIILPIMPMAMITDRIVGGGSGGGDLNCTDGSKDDDHNYDDHHYYHGMQLDGGSKMARIQSLNKNEIIKFINEKLGLNLPPSTEGKNGDDDDDERQQQHRQQQQQQQVEEHVKQPEYPSTAVHNEDSLIMGTKNLHLISAEKSSIIPMDSSSSCCHGNILNNNSDSVENHHHHHHHHHPHLVGSHSSSPPSSASSSYSAPSSFPTIAAAAATTTNLLVSPLSLIHSSDGYNYNNNNNNNNTGNSGAGYCGAAVAAASKNNNNNSNSCLDDNFVNFNYNQCLNNAIIETGISSSPSSSSFYDEHYNQFHCGAGSGLSQQQHEPNDGQQHENSRLKSYSQQTPMPAASPMNYGWRISDEVYKNAIELEFTANPLMQDSEDSPPTGVPSSGQDNQISNNVNNNHNCNLKLNELERKKLQEVNEQFAHWYDVGDNPEHLIITDVYDGLNFMEFALRKLIMSLKWITSFKNLCQEDQIVLLKRSASTIKCVVSLHFTTLQDGNCIIPNPSDQQNSRLVFEREYLQRTYGVELYSRCRSFCLSFRKDWRDDVSILNLLAMILLFYPHRANLIHREYINLEYLSYCHLLQRYLQSKYSSICEAKTIYLNLLSRLQEINYLNDQCMDLVFKLDPKNIGPLISELMNINKNIPAVELDNQSPSTNSSPQT